MLQAYPVRRRIPPEKPTPPAFSAGRADWPARCAVMDRSSEKRLQRNSGEDLTDDLIVDILSRLPVKSVCRFKSVSWHWRRLIAHPDHRKKLPQTLSGFFYSNEFPADGTVSNPYIVSDTNGDGHTASSPILVWDTEDEYEYDQYYMDGVTEVSFPDFVSILPAEEDQSPVVPDRSLSFLPATYRSVVPKHCCSGHLLCFYWEVPPPTATEAQYLVCNPATQQWRTFPRDHRSSISDYPPPPYLWIDDDPATTSFHVVVLIESCYGFVHGVDIYSSESGTWSHNDCEWDEIRVLHISVLLYGMLHLISVEDLKVVAVDRDGKTWNTIPLLEGMYQRRSYTYSVIQPLIGKSQERLLYMNHKADDYFSISVWILEDYYSGGRWVFRCKYNINTPQVFGPEVHEDRKIYNVVTVHPDCNVILFTVGKGSKKKLMSCDMDRDEIRVVGGMEGFTDGWLDGPYILYVPSFSRSIFAEEVVTK